MDSTNLYVKNATNSAYAGETLHGVVCESYLSGVKIFDANEKEMQRRFVAGAAGKLLMHGVRTHPSHAHAQNNQ